MNWTLHLAFAGLTALAPMQAMGQGTPAMYWDGDGDGYGSGAPIDFTIDMQVSAAYVTSAGDCEDWNPAVNPGAAEMFDLMDNNCNGVVDEGLTPSFVYLDSDGDGYGDPMSMMPAFFGLSGYVEDAGDCDDWNPASHPGAAEVFDAMDNDCDGSVDEGLELLGVGNTSGGEGPEEGDGAGGGEAEAPTFAGAAPISAHVAHHAKIGGACQVAVGDTKTDAHPTDGSQVQCTARTVTTPSTSELIPAAARGLYCTVTWECAAPQAEAAPPPHDPLVCQAAMLGRTLHLPTGWWSPEEQWWQCRHAAGKGYYWSKEAMRPPLQPGSTFLVEAPVIGTGSGGSLLPTIAGD